MASNRPTKIGQAELELLQFVAANGSVSVREATEHFAASRGYVRSTLQQMLERLRVKGFLVREDVEGLLRYRSVDDADTLRTSLVERLIEGPLSGSVSPFVAYLSHRGHVSEKEMAELRRLVDELEVKPE